jgi:DeoR/GlpR family transcriptional regulator of sugar metabolism
MTVRRDLSVLEAQGAVTLFHGGAVYNQREGGGDPDTEYSLVSAESQRVAEKRRIGRAAGISLKLAVTCLNGYERDTKVAAIRSSLSRVLVADSSKFGTIQPAYFGEIDDFDTVVTDDGIGAEIAAEIEARGIELIVA